jgi:CRISPR-associated protein Cas6
MAFVDVIFPARGDVLPTDHAYPLYTALTRVVPAFHDDRVPLTFNRVNGQAGGKGLIRLFARSALRCRVPAEHIPLLLPLAGTVLAVAGHTLRLGVPRVAPLVPAAALAAKMVTFKHATDAARFLAVAAQKLTALGIAAEVGIPLIESGQRQGEPRRQVLRVKGRRIIGFACQVAGLTAEESVLLQEQGLGGRRRMGCGFFLPLRARVA